MAVNGCFAVTFIDACKNSFYFSLGEPELVEDVFRDSHQSTTHMLQSNDDKILMLSDERRYEARQLTKRQREQHECRFNIHIFEKELDNCSPGRTVLLYVKKDDKKLVVCCNEKNGIYPREMEIPREIDKIHSNTLFTLTKIKGLDKYKFESIAYPQRFLGFESEEQDSHVDKLVLREGGKDAPDEQAEVLLL